MNVQGQKFTVRSETNKYSRYHFITWIDGLSVVDFERLVRKPLEESIERHYLIANRKLSKKAQEIVTKKCGKTFGEKFVLTSHKTTIRKD